MPRTALVALDTVSLVRSALDPEAYRSVVKSVAVAELSTATHHLIQTLAEGFSIRPGRLEAEAADERVAQWRRHYHDLVHRLTEEGVGTTPNPEEGMEAYISSRKEWHPYVHALAESMLYETETVAGTPSV